MIKHVSQYSADELKELASGLKRIASDFHSKSDFIMKLNETSKLHPTTLDVAASYTGDAALLHLCASLYCQLAEGNEGAV